MRVLDVSMWGFLLEHESMPFFIPVINTPVAIPMTSQVQLRPDLVVRIKQTDKPFYIDKLGAAHMLTEESEYVPEIKKAMVHYVMASRR